MSRDKLIGGEKGVSYDGADGDAFNQAHLEGKNHEAIIPIYAKKDSEQKLRPFNNALLSAFAPDLHRHGVDRITIDEEIEGAIHEKTLSNALLAHSIYLRPLVAVLIGIPTGWWYIPTAEAFNDAYDYPEPLRTLCLIGGPLTNWAVNASLGAQILTIIAAVRFNAYLKELGISAPKWYQYFMISAAAILGAGPFFMSGMHEQENILINSFNALVNAIGNYLAFSYGARFYNDIKTWGKPFPEISEIPDLNAKLIADFSANEDKDIARLTVACQIIQKDILLDEFPRIRHQGKYNELTRLSDLYRENKDAKNITPKDLVQNSFIEAIQFSQNALRHQDMPIELSPTVEKIRRSVTLLAILCGACSIEGYVWTTLQAMINYIGGGTSGQDETYAGGAAGLIPFSVLIVLGGAGFASNFVVFMNNWYQYSKRNIINNQPYYPAIINGFIKAGPVEWQSHPKLSALFSGVLGVAVCFSWPTAILLMSAMVKGVKETVEILGVMGGISFNGSQMGSFTREALLFLGVLIKPINSLCTYKKRDIGQLSRLSEATAARQSFDDILKIYAKLPTATRQLILDQANPAEQKQGEEGFQRSNSSSKRLKLNFIGAAGGHKKSPSSRTQPSEEESDVAPEDDAQRPSKCCSMSRCSIL